MKTLNEILKNVPERIIYTRVAEQLQCLAMTEYAEIIEKQGGKILTCSPKMIKLDTGKTVKVIGNYIKYIKNDMIYYIQFDTNPFFNPMGYKEMIGEKIHSMNMIEIPMLYDNVEAYNIDSANVQKLINNLKNFESYLKEFYCRTLKKYDKKYCEQKIYYNV